MNHECLGIDLGSSKMALATARYVKPNEPRVVTTPGGMKSIPPSVGFRGKSRFVGEAASMQSRSNAVNTIEDLSFYLGATPQQLLASSGSPLEYFRRWTLASSTAHTQPKAVVEYNGASAEFDLRALTSMLLSQARSFQAAAKLREGGEKTQEGEPCCVALAVPDSYTAEQRTAVCDAARLAKLEIVALTTTSGALAASFASGREQASQGSGGKQEENTVMFVDIGHTCTSVSITTFATGDSTSHVVAAVEATNALGARNCDLALYQYVVAELLKKGHTIDPKSKAGSSVLRECAKAKKILSSNRETQLFMEQYGTNIKVTRNDIDTQCKQACATLQEMVRACLTKTGIVVDDLLTVEMSGGGARIPCFRDAVSSVVGGSTKLTTTLSPEAVAQGAATFGCLFVNAKKHAEYEVDRRAREVLRKENAKIQKAKEAELFKKAAELKAQEAAAAAQKETEEGAASVEEAVVEEPETAAMDTTPVEETPEAKQEELPPVVVPTSTVPASAMTSEEINAAVALEHNMLQVDEELKAIEAAKNALESFLYEMQSVLDGNGKYKKYASLLNKEILEPLLNEAQQQLWDAPDDAALDVFEDALTSLNDAFQKESPDYFQAVQKDKEEEEEQMRLDEKKAEEERKANGEDDDDHDHRKLKSADRMRLVQRNKDEAGELFKGKNFLHAAARYTKSLGHCGKFVDMTPEVKVQVEEIKVILYLNLAQCYLKLEQWNKVVPNCKDALSFDENNVKALYRRAYALFKLKKIDDANKDVKRALKIKADDKSLLKLKKVIDAHLMKQKQKEAKMAKAMFGGK